MSASAPPRNDSARDAGAPAPRARSWWSRWGWTVRWGGTALGVAYVIRIVDLASLRSASAHVRLGTLIAALAVTALGLVFGAVRWRVLLRAYGAPARPALVEAIRLYFIAVFYNTYLPGGVAGDLLRGVVTRDSFGEGGATEAIAVVLVERALGLLGVVGLAALGLLAVGDRVADTGGLWMWSGAAGAFAIVAVLMLPLARRLARLLPRRLAALAARLPGVSRPLDFLSAAALSVLTQLVAAISGWLFLRDFYPGVTFLDALFIVPLALATTFLPITVGGAGAREAVFITLCGELLGMPSGDALAVSLLVWLTSLVAGAVGGLLQLLGGASAPRREPPSGEPGPSAAARPPSR
ncbi:MAG: lysylphosphatidylglycerol synthase transmembrane domain-containing protein [Kofleriaceae bacterium]